MRSTIAGILVLGMLATSCATDPLDTAGDQPESASTTSTSPVTTTPATTSPASTSPIEDSPTVGSTEPGTTNDEREDAGEPEEQEPTVTTNPPKSSPEPGLPPTPVEPLPEGPVASAVADLAARLGVDVSAVAVVAQEEVTWSNAALGCPHPDMSYAQVLVNGSLLVLRVDGTDHQYHSGGGRGFFYCANPTKPASGGFGDV